MTMTDEDEADLRRAEVPETLPTPSRQELAAQVAELEETVQTLSNLVSSFSARMLRNVDDLKEEMGRRVNYADLADIQKELGKIRARIDDIVDEVGYGEALDIAKVPPGILEAAYQAILDDVISELKKARGAHDAELHILHSLEQLRLKTSGSELFTYKPHRIHVGVAKALEKNLASARQVQMTYEELLRHLLEPIHYHTPKNFRAIIKIKSQEYAVDTAMTLAEQAVSAVPRLDALESRVEALAQQLTDALKDVQEFAGRLETTLANLATQESVEAIGMRVVGLEQTRAASTPREGPSTEARVLEELRAKPRTLAALKRELKVDEDALRAVLDDLERDGRISSSVRGRSTTYRMKEENDDA